MNPPNQAETNCGLSHCTGKEWSDLTTVTHLGCGAHTSPRAAQLPYVTPAHQIYGLRKLTSLKLCVKYLNIYKS